MRQQSSTFARKDDFEDLLGDAVESPRKCFFSHSRHFFVLPQSLVDPLTDFAAADIAAAATAIVAVFDDVAAAVIFAAFVYASQAVDDDEKIILPQFHGAIAELDDQVTNRKSAMRQMDALNRDERDVLNEVALGWNCAVTVLERQTDRRTKAKVGKCLP